MQAGHWICEIAFSRAEVDGSWHIWSLPTSGGTPRRLTSSPGGEVYPRYGKAGGFLLVHPWQTPRRIGRLARDGGSPQVLSVGDASDAFPDLSPDGRQLLMTRTDSDAATTSMRTAPRRCRTGAKRPSSGATIRATAAAVANTRSATAPRTSDS